MTKKSAAEKRHEQPKTVDAGSGVVLEVQDVDSQPAASSEPQNGVPSNGPAPKLGMTLVASRDKRDQLQSHQGETVRMRHAAYGAEADVDFADVEVHTRMGWRKVDEE